MSKENVIRSDVKISRHCELDRFVDRVSTRMKHSSGLAIHENVEILAVAPEHPPIGAATRFSHKSKFYIQAEQAYKRRGAPDPELQSRLDAVKAEKEKQRQILENYKKEFVSDTHQFYMDDGITIPPDPKIIAMRRHLYIVGSLPSNY